MRRLVALLPVLIAFQAGAPPALAWTWPADGPVLRPFVLGDDPYAGGQHRGVDIGAEAGAPVRSPAAGVVSFAGTVPGGGRSVTVQTDDGYSMTLVHLGSIAVARATLLAEGAPVGLIGPTGDAEHAEPYVHFGVRITSEPNGYVDPLSLLPARETIPPPAPPPPPAEPSPVAPPVDTPEVPAPAPVAPLPVPEEAPAPDPQEPRAQTSVNGTLPGRGRIEAVPRQTRPASTGTETSKSSDGAVAPYARPTRLLLRSFEIPGVQARASQSRAEREPPAPRARGGATVDIVPAVGAAAALLGLAAAALGVRRRQLGHAGSAHAPASVLHHGAGRAAEYAGAPRSAEENRLVSDRDLERVPFGEPESLPDLDRDDDPAELIEVADNPCRRLPAASAPRPFHRLSSHTPSRCRRAELISAR